MGYWWLAGLATALVAAAAAAFALERRFRRRRSTGRLQAARRQFEEDRSLLAAEFFHAAATSGKPRGLRWKACDLAGPPLLARDAGAGVLFGFVAATVSFEAIAGGGMEEVAAVGNLRSATAVFLYRDDQWSTEGRVLFNLEPHEAVKHFQATLQPVAD
ncbi:MAG: hypothetical protein IT424_04065 [Pirellulales bacterium]|nr:hypothetical protein [Pirellulales bacterium]